MIGQISATTSRALRRVLVLVAASVAPLAFASAAAAAPTGEYANFGDCPLSNSAVVTCVYAQTTGGEFVIGSTAVPITKTITLQGGLANPAAGVYELAAATDGNTLSKTPQTVPGGLFKIVAPESWPGWLQSIFNGFVNKGLTGVTATTELAGTAHLAPFAAITGNGTALELPVKVHLENPFLGSKCYVGSNSKPVTVELTTGTTSPPAPNEPISGSVGEVELKNGGNLLIINNNSLVNNSFSAPVAEGCGGIFSFLIDPAVDAEIGLPSAAGHNTAILNGSQELASANAVRESEE